MNGFDLIIQPDDEEAGAADVFVDGRIGERPYRLLLDTGAAKTSVLFDEYTATFASVGQHTSSGVFAGQSNDVITVPVIEVGPIIRKDFTVVRIAQGTPHARNLIGMDLLKDVRCHFFFDEGRVSVDTEDGAEVPHHALYLDSRFHPYIDVHMDERGARAVWDTGAGMTVADTGFIEMHPALFQEIGQSQGTDAVGVQAATPMFIMATSAIGDHPFPPITVAGVDLSRVNATLEVPMDLILGYNLLSLANWVMDFPSRTWAITRRWG